MKYQILVTAHIQDGNNENVMIIKKVEFDHPVKFIFGDWLEAMFAGVNWVIDDGDDIPGSTYVQYVAYTEPDTHNYLLASYDSTEA